MAENPVLEKVYDPRAVEPDIYALWEQSGAFHSKPQPTTAKTRDRTFTIVIPPPNVTGALHLGHALNNTLQDILIRYHRMRGFNTLWQPGTDHAGIATQAVVERRIREQEGKTRHDLGRDELVQRIWQWKDEYEKRIISQLKLMGCSCDWGFREVVRDGAKTYECDWSRTRFTMDEGLARAVRHMFFKLFKDGLIFRGKRLVNWDTQLQTAVSDDEVYYETVKGHFWHFKYPVIDPTPGDPEHVNIATTRPETMLGDTAVAVHPDPAGFFDDQEAQLRDSLTKASSKERAELEAKLKSLRARRESHLARLVQLRDMAKDGRKVRLPLVEREIPLIADEWADPTLGTGCVKITPAHDPNDYEVGLRHELPMVNVLTSDGKIARIIEPDGSTNPNSPEYEGLAFSSDGRAQVVADMTARGLLHETEDHEVEIGHSDRSKLPIEPYLSDQWFLQTGDVSEPRANTTAPLGLTLGDGSRTSGLAQAAIEAVEDGRIEVFPPRYAKSYLDWLGEKRDWCISRQLWWGHRIPIWAIRFTPAFWAAADEPNEVARRRHEETCIRDLNSLFEHCGVRDDVLLRKSLRLEEGYFPWYICGRSNKVDELLEGMNQILEQPPSSTSELQRYLSHQAAFAAKFGESALRRIRQLEAEIYSFGQEEDVLDTWFSSALWPFSTLGWPDATEHLQQYYPGSVLCTSRDIITNWVARMVMFGLYAIGKVPFHHVYIHPKILDGRGETMSKSKGNGVDPVDIIRTHGADAMRYSLADMTTETQDIRMPVEYVCPHCGELTDQTVALKAEEQARRSRSGKLDHRLQPADCVRVKCSHKECSKEFATQWADDTLKEKLGLARETSDKFEIGRNFCNKLWNAARFAFMNLQDPPCVALDIAALPPEDRWILARLSQTIRRYHQRVQNYQFSASVKELREFFWDSLCDWYLELAKPRLAPEPRASARAGSPVPTEPQRLARADVGTSEADRTFHGDTARQVLAFCLDQTLRLWHPTIPFITERLWQQLNGVAPRRGLPGVADLSTDSPLISAAFPPEDGYPALDDETIVNVFADIQDVVRAIRDLRANCSVSPRDAVKATVVLPEAECKAFEAHAHIVRRMANVSDLTVEPHARRPPNAGSVTMGSLRVFVHDVSDDQAERARTTKALAALEKQIAGKASKLANERFVANAKPEIVEAERERLTELLRQKAGLESHLAELAD